MSRRDISVAGAVVLLSILAIAMVSRRNGDNAHSASPAQVSARSSGAILASNPTPSSLLFPEEYAVVQSRNPFGHSRSGAGATGPETSFVFKGAIQTGSTFTAFIEDLNHQTVLQTSVGDSVARGHIQSIDLDAVQYATAGGCRRVEPGQSLDGLTVAPPASQSSTQPADAPAKE